MADELEILSSLDPVPGVSGNPGPDPLARPLQADDDMVELSNKPATSRAPLTGRLLGLAAVLVLVGGIAAAFLTGDDKKPESQDVAIAPVAAIPVQPIGAEDGTFESLRHPVVATPFEGLNDGDMVTVTGANFPPNDSLLIVQCWLVGERGSAETCDVADLEQGFTADDGTFEATFPVRRFMSIGGETKDCAESTVDEGCYLAIAAASNYDESGITPLFFLPDGGGTPPPVLNADVTNNLRDGDEVLVTGSGFLPDEVVSLVQCSIGGLTSVSGCAGVNTVFTTTASPDGEIAAFVPVRRTVLSHEGLVDCAVTACQLLSPRIPSSNLILIEFDPDGTIGTLPDITVEPSTDLVDGQSIDVMGFDLPFADGPVYVSQCVDADNGACGERVAAEITDGRFTQDFRVSRRIDGFDSGQPDTDCVLSTCVLRVFVSGSTLTDIPMEFKGAPATSTEPAILASPTTGLSHLDEIEVDAPLTSGVALCTTSSGCTTLYEARDDRVELPVVRVPRVSWKNGVLQFDCAIETCTLLSVDRMERGQELAKLSFLPDPLPEKPSFALDVTAPVVHGQTVSIIGPDLAPAQTVSICTPRSACNFTVQVTDGAFDLSRVVPRSAVGGDDSQSPWVDCADVGCSLEVTTIEGSFVLPIEFDASTPPPEAPQISATVLDRSDGVTSESEFVEFALADFTPNRYEVRIASCQASTCNETGSISDLEAGRTFAHDFQEGLEKCLTADACELTIDNGTLSYTVSIPRLLASS